MSAVQDKSEKLSSEWSQVKLGDVLQVIRGASPRPKGDPRYFGGDIPWIKISDITKEKGKYISTTKDHVTEKGAQKSRYLKAGTLILSNSGTVCVPKILAVDGCIHDGFVAFPELSDEFDILYLYYFFDKIRPQIINENRQGITQVNLNTTIVKNIDLPVAPENEQKRIVAEIEKQFSRLDEAVDNLKRVKANLKRYKASVLKAAVKGRLTEEWRAAHPDVEPAEKLLERILAERRKKWEEAELAKMKKAGKVPKDDKWKKKYKPPALLDTEHLPVVPVSWVWTTLDQVGQETRPILYGIIKPGPHIPDGVPYVRVMEMKDGHIDVSILKRTSPERAAKFTRATLMEGDILISKDGTIGRVAIVPPELEGGNITQHVMRAPSHVYVNNYYIAWAIRSPICQRWLSGETKGVALRGVNVEDFRRLPIPAPPVKEQNKIVDEIEHRMSIIGIIDEEIEKNILRAERLRQSILKKAFSGKLVPQNSSDKS